MPVTSFPVVAGTTLAGTDLALPADLPAPWTLLVVRFREELDPLADQWVRVAERIAEGSGGQLAALELLFVGRRFRWFRSVIDARLSAQAESAAERARTLPLYLDRGRFRKQLGLKDENEVYVLLVSRSGRVAWRGEGGLTPDKVAEMEHVVGETLSPLAAGSAPPQSVAGGLSGTPGPA